MSDEPHTFGAYIIILEKHGSKTSCYTISLGVRQSLLKVHQNMYREKGLSHDLIIADGEILGFETYNKAVVECFIKSF